MCDAAPSNDSGGSSGVKSSPRPKPKPKQKPKKTVSVGYKGGQVDPRLAKAAGLKAKVQPTSASIGYGAGQVDPSLAKAAGLKDSGRVPVTSTGGKLVKSASDGSIVTSIRPKARPSTASSTGGGGDSSSSSSSSKSAPAPAPAAAPAGGPATTPLSLNESYSDKKPSTARRRRRGGKRPFTNKRQEGTGIGGVGGGVGLNIPK